MSARDSHECETENARKSCEREYIVRAVFLSLSLSRFLIARTFSLWARTILEFYANINAACRGIVACPPVSSPINEVIIREER